MLIVLCPRKRRARRRKHVFRWVPRSGDRPRAHAARLCAVGRAVPPKSQLDDVPVLPLPVGEAGKAIQAIEARSHGQRRNCAKTLRHGQRQRA